VAQDAVPRRRVSGSTFHLLAGPALFAPETFRRSLEEINPEDRGLAA
jgi:hypothetical protein